MVNPILGSLLLALGLACLLRPYEVARFEERVDSIGSKRSWSAIEPADWKVIVTRITGIAIALFGALVFFNI